MSRAQHGNRPRPTTLVQLDLHNAYAKLGVSPLATTEEIKRVADQKRRELMRKRRSRGQQQFGAEEAEMTELQTIEAQIGSTKGRTAYDRANPQNELLTIQPAPHDRWLDPRHRANLITAWLLEELGRDAVLPSPESLALWAPNGISPELATFLREFLTNTEPTAGTPAASEASMFPAVSDLEQLSAPNPTPPEPTPKETPPNA